MNTNHTDEEIRKLVYKKYVKNTRRFIPELEYQIENVENVETLSKGVTYDQI